MGLLDKTTDAEYYEGDNLGGYQFTSLDDIITQFQIAYVGEDKIISKIKRSDIAFHAQRGLQEFSFDTLKSFKAQQIDVPANLQMKLPHDYVNYTKLSWVDTAGIKHPLFPISNTSNPFQVWQEEGGEYEFPEDLNLVINGDFSADNDAYEKPVAPWYRNSIPHINSYATQYGSYNAADGVLRFKHRTRTGYGTTDHWGHVMSVWQKINVVGQAYIDISATGTALDQVNGPGVLRFGISSIYPSNNTKMLPTEAIHPISPNSKTSAFDLKNVNGNPSYVEWRSTDGATVSKELLSVDVRDHTEVYVLITSFHEYTGAQEVFAKSNSIDDIEVRNSSRDGGINEDPNAVQNSSTWNSFKANKSSENQDDYKDDTYWPMDGSRFGLDPQHAQTNGSFFIDQRIGKIHFSSNISGKTVILDYISDSLGTDGEMQVHKFAEEAMYKHIAHAILATRANTPEYIVQRLKKERFAAVRTAKLRLSSLKLEELTQILRGKSKQIKH